MTTSNKSGKLLVVDSSTAMLHVLKNFTAKHGYNADHFSDPADACTRLDQRFQDFSCDYRSVVLGWPEGRLNLIEDLLQKLSSADHDALPLNIIAQDMTADVLAQVKRRPRTRAFLWSDYQQVADVIDLTARHHPKRGKTVVVSQAGAKGATPASVNSENTAQGPALQKADQNISEQELAESTIRSADYSTSFSLLLVDTAPSICESLRGKLESAGYQITVAGSVSEAQEKLVKTNFDVVVTDFFLRDESGEALCRQLQAADSRSKPICVVLTAKYSDSIVKRSLSVGAAACLYKNESTELLFARIDALTRTLRRQSRQLVQQRSRLPVQQQSSGKAPKSQTAVKTVAVKEGRTASLHTATQTQLQPNEEQRSGAGRRGVVKLVTRQMTDESEESQKPGPIKPHTKNVTANSAISKPAAKSVITKKAASAVPTRLSESPKQTPAEGTKLNTTISVADLLVQLKGRNSSAQYSVLMLDVQIVAATGDRMALCDSEPMQNLVAKSLRKLYPKQNAQARTEDGKFVLLLTTAKFQDALVLTRKILQVIPKMVPYLNNMSLVAHAGILRIESDEVIDQVGLLQRCEAACQQARKDGKDNAALVLPNNQYLSAVAPQAGTASTSIQSPESNKITVKSAATKSADTRDQGIKEQDLKEQVLKEQDIRQQKEQPQTA